MRVFERKDNVTVDKTIKAETAVQTGGELRLTKKEKRIMIAVGIAFVAAAVLLALNMPMAAGFLNGALKALVNKLVDIFSEVIKVVGVMMLVVAIFQFFLALMQQNPDGKNTAAQHIAISLSLISMKTFFQSLNLASLL